MEEAMMTGANNEGLMQEEDWTQDEDNDSDDNIIDNNPNNNPNNNQRYNRNPIKNPPLGRRTQLDHVPKTPFAPLYRSIFTIKASTGPSQAGLNARLAHCNCSYLSTKGIAPSLPQLKQHAQALVMLIKSFTVSTLPALIDNVNSGIPGSQKTSFNDGETYDFLNDLRTAYTGPKNPDFHHHHNMPLHALMNIVQESTRHGGQGMMADQPVHEVFEDICPLHEVKPSDVNGKSLPYAQCETLIAHANEILELLDHEYSAKGGILAILPEKDSKDPVEREQYVKSQTTLLGQMIQHHQRLVMRVHDLERNYSNALDALAGEAAVPAQALTKLGPDGRKGREIVYPQDRFVLANCGEDLWDYLDYEFTKKEKADEAVRSIYSKSGVLGQEMFAKNGKREFERGITVLDVTTRYIRLRKDPLKTVFIIPAHEHHPGTKATRDMEKVPTVVSIAKPMWPERQSLWEMKNRAQIDELKKLRSEYERAKYDTEVANNSRAMMKAAEKQHRLINEELKKKLKDCDARIKPDETAAVAAANKERDEALAALANIEAEKKALSDEKIALKQMTKATREKDSRLAKEQDAFQAAKIANEKRANAEIESRRTALAELEAQVARDAAELQKRLRKEWRKQIEETQSLLTSLKLRKAVSDQTIAGESDALAKGLTEGTALFKQAVDDYKATHPLVVVPDDEQRGFDAYPMQDGSDVDMYD